MAYFAVKSHPHSYGKQNHYAQQYNISRTTRSGLFVLSSVDRRSWFVPTAAEKICKKNMNTASEDYLYLYVVPHTSCVFGRPHIKDAIICTLRSLEWSPCANASSLWFNLTLTHFPSFSLPAAFVSNIFVVHCRCVTVFSTFVWFTASSHYCLYDFTINISHFLWHQGWNSTGWTNFAPCVL